MKTVSIKKVNDTQFLAVAKEDGEYWFTIGWYSSAKTAARYAAKKMAQYGYKFVPVKLEKSAR